VRNKQPHDGLDEDPRPPLSEGLTEKVRDPFKKLRLCAFRCVQILRAIHLHPLEDRMTLNRRTALGTVLCAAIPPASLAQARYPTKPIKLIVHTLPGSVSDTTARAVAQELGLILGQAVVVDNKAGAGGLIGAQMAAQSAPDGYTLLAGGSSVIATLPAVSRKKLAFDPDGELEPIGMIARLPYILVVNGESRFKSVGDLVAAARENPGKLTYGSAGQGTNPHMIFEILCQEYGIKMTHVPYKGPSAAQTDLMGGSIDALFDTPSSVIPHIASGRFRPLANTGKKRTPQLPAIQTFVELGRPNLHVEGWSALYTRKGTPAEIVSVLKTAFKEAMATPSVHAAVVDTGNHIDVIMGDEILAEQRTTREKWRKIAVARNILVD